MMMSKSFVNGANFFIANSVLEKTDFLQLIISPEFSFVNFWKKITG
jgi:hypothetical protein